MSKVTSKLQVTVPKELADRYGIRPGSEIDWVPAGDSLRVIPGSAPSSSDPAERLRLFDAATARQKKRQGRRPARRPADRGWKREDLYTRGLPR
ncbi:MAG TPA: AbrB/MazE/SpoVT family DNA-binding domain-containing protein [Polyangiaceae bacterium]|jgi:AbrB family looped-hinge helix DNA binding protein